MTKIVAIVGGTASGKSDLAVQVAKKFNGEVISADSRQVYKGLDIGTGKITQNEMDGIPHHLLDVALPDKRFTVKDYTELAEKALKNISSRNKLPIVCGGTGFYVSALLDGISFPNVAPNNELREKLNKKSAQELWIELREKDQIRAKNIDPKNKRRLIRALEIISILGSVPKIETKTDTGLHKQYHCLYLGTQIEPKLLRDKIYKRLIQRIENGMIEEGEMLHKNGLDFKRMDELGLEYRYLAKYLSGSLTKEKMIDELFHAIWQYSRRQMTWFKKDKRIVWINPMEIEKVFAVIENFLKN